MLRCAGGHVPCVIADCDGISSAVSLRLCTYLMESMMGHMIFRPGSSVRWKRPKRSMIHASCCGTKLMIYNACRIGWALREAPRRLTSARGRRRVAGRQRARRSRRMARGAPYSSAASDRGSSSLTG